MLLLSVALAGPPAGAWVVLPPDAPVVDPTGHQSISFTRPILAQVVGQEGTRISVRPLPGGARAANSCTGEFGSPHLNLVLAIEEENLGSVLAASISSGTSSRGWMVAAGTPVVAMEGSSVTVQLAPGIRARVDAGPEATARWAAPAPFPLEWTNASGLDIITDYVWAVPGLSLVRAPMFRANDDLGMVSWSSPCAILRDTWQGGVEGGILGGVVGGIVGGTVGPASPAPIAGSPVLAGLDKDVVLHWPDGTTAGTHTRWAAVQADEHGCFDAEIAPTGRGTLMVCADPADLRFAEAVLGASTQSPRRDRELTARLPTLADCARSVLLRGPDDLRESLKRSDLGAIASTSPGPIWANATARKCVQDTLSDLLVGDEVVELVFRSVSPSS